MRFRIITFGGSTAEIDAPNWMVAVGQALASQGVGAERVARCRCTPLSDGTIRIEEAGREASWTVGPVREAPSPPAKPVPNEPPPPAKPAPRAPPPRHVAHVRAADPGARVPSPLQTLPEFELEPLYTEETTAVKLFEWSSPIIGQPRAEACHLALKLAHKFVKAEAGSIYLWSEKDQSLEIVAATGPVADRVRGRKIPFGMGLAGQCMDTGRTIRLSDAKRDGHHYPRFDEELGFVTRGVLCVPLKGENGVLGVIQLLNPEREFQPLDADTLASVAQVLASALGE